MKPEAILKAIGGVAVGGFGDRVLMGIFMGAFGSPDQCYQYIKENRKLFKKVSDRQWQVYQKLAKAIDDAPNILAPERIISELREHRADLLGVIINTPGGEQWLQAQITELRQKLGLE